MNCPEQEPLLVHMLHLAQQYKVHDCISACLNALIAIPQLQPKTVHLVYSLISYISDEPGMASLMQHCSDHLQQQFGNLEVAVTDAQSLGALHKLPHSGKQQFATCLVGGMGLCLAYSNVRHRCCTLCSSTSLLLLDRACCLGLFMPCTFLSQPCWPCYKMNAPRQPLRTLSWQQCRAG